MAEETRTHSAAAGSSKQVIRRLRLTGDLIASLKIHEKEVAEALGEILLPHLEPGERLDPRVLIRVLRRLIEDRQDRLGRADYTRWREDGHDFERRVDLKESIAEVRRLLLDLRQAAAGCYGRRAGDRFLGFKGRIGRYSTELLTEAQEVLARLADPEWPLPKPRYAHADLGRDRWLALLEAPVRQLARADHEHGMDRKGTETAVIHRGLTMDQHDHDVHWVARWVVAMYSLAGREAWTSDLSPRSRRRQRRKRRSQAPKGEQGRPEARSGA